MIPCFDGQGVWEFGIKLGIEPVKKGTHYLGNRRLEHNKGFGNKSKYTYKQSNFCSVGNCNLM